MEDPRFTQTRDMFSMTCRVVAPIRATPERIWRLLTDAPGFPRWNSTVTSIEGHIGEGQQIRVRVPGTERTFTPTVTGIVPGMRMTWSDGFAPLFKGVRTFELTPRPDGATVFTMQERFSGLMLPLIKPSLPDFGPIFTRYASDLTRAVSGRWPLERSGVESRRDNGGKEAVYREKGRARAAENRPFEPDRVTLPGPPDDARNTENPGSST